MNSKKTCGIYHGNSWDGMGVGYQNGIPPQKMGTQSAPNGLISGGRVLLGLRVAPTSASMGVVRLSSGVALFQDDE